MSIESLRTLQARSGMSSADLARLIGIKPDQLLDLQFGKSNFRRLHAHGLDKASLTLALEKRDPSLLTPHFRKQIVRIAVMLLQEADSTPERGQAASGDQDVEKDAAEAT